MTRTGLVSVNQGAAGKAMPASPGLKSLLASAGLLKAGIDPGVVAKNLLSNLKTLGFVPKGGKGLEAQLAQALTSMQKANGLKTTGALDKNTVALLQKMGALPQAAQRTSAGVAKVKDGFERAAPQTQAQAAANAKAERPPLTGLRNFLAGNLGAPGRAMGNAVASAGEQLSRAGAFLSRVGAEAGQGLEAVRDGIANPAQTAADGGRAAGNAAPQGRAQANPANVAAHGLVPQQKTDQERGRAHAPLARRKAKSRGLDAGDPLAEEGVGDESGHRGFTGGGEGQGGAPEDEGGGDGATPGPPDDETTERYTGNAPSGDEAFADASRGHATLNDGSEDEAGHYKIPPISRQIGDALRAISKDPDRPNQPITYSWDVRLYRPAIYGAHQKAEELLHLEVRSATPFDPVWEKSLTALARHLKRREPKAKPPDLLDIQAALRRARVSSSS